MSDVSLFLAPAGLYMILIGFILTLIEQILKYIE